MGRKRTSPASELLGWLKRQSMRVKICLGVAFSLFALVVLRYTIRRHSHFFLASEATHFAGIIVLVYKLTTNKTCSGLSLKTQALTALFLFTRMLCGIAVRTDIHVLIDFATLAATAWVIYMIHFKLKSTYIKELDNFPVVYLLLVVFVLALLINPYLMKQYWLQVLWAFSTYLEALAVLPQLRFMQNTKMIEPFTARYVFALGVSRFFSCAYWIVMLCETSGRYLYIIGSGYFWFTAAFIAEIVQTFILADFCYYYVKSVMNGQLLMRMPV